MALMFEARSRTPFADTPFAFAFMLCDSMGGDRRVGVSHVFVPTGAAGRNE